MSGICLKKKILLFSIILVAMVLFFGCAGDATISKNRMSETTVNMFLGENEKYSAKIFCGYREEPYSFNGISNANVEFGVISLESKASKFEQQKLAAKLSVNAEVFDIMLEKNPYADEMVFDIGKIVASGSELILTIEGETMLFNDIVANFAFGYEAAIKQGETALKDFMKSAMKSGNIECYLKILYDGKNQLKNCFWQFSFLGENKDFKVCVIDPNNLDVLAIN